MAEVKEAKCVNVEWVSWICSDDLVYVEDDVRRVLAAQTCSDEKGAHWYNKETLDIPGSATQARITVTVEML